MTNTIPNVPRELLEDANRSLQELAFAGELHLSCQKGLVISCACTDCMSDRAIDTNSKIRALLSAPSSACVDGLEVVATWFARGDVGVPEPKANMVDGVQLCRLSDAQAIIDGLRGEVEVMTQNANNYSRMFEECAEERDQQAQRVGELEGLLDRVKVSLSLDETEWGYSAPEKYKLLADIRAALSAGKEVE